MQIASRIAAWQSGKKLPYDAEVEWLEFSANYWFHNSVDSFRLCDANSTVKIDFLARGGSAISGSYENGCYFEINMNPNDWLYWGAEIKNIGVSEITLGERHTVEANGETKQYLVDGVSVGVIKNTYKKASISFCFGGLNDTRGMSHFLDGMIYGVTMKDVYHGETGEKCNAEWICVRKDGVGYFYDKVSGELRGESIGRIPLGIGPDKV